MKTALYVAVVTRAYRRAIDDCLQSVDRYRANLDWYREETGRCTHRQFGTGFYFGKPDHTMQIYDAAAYISEYTYLGTVCETDGRGRVRIEQRNKFCVGDRIEIMKPQGNDVAATVEKIEDEQGNTVESAPHPRQALWLTLSEKAGRWDILRMRKDTEHER